jgi:hypothetical protein
MLMSEIAIITNDDRRQRWSAAEKLRIVEETMFEGESISLWLVVEALKLNPTIHFDSHPD